MKRTTNLKLKNAHYGCQSHMGENFYGDVIFSTTPHTLTRGFTKGSRKIAKKKREMLSWKRAKTRKIRKVPGAPPHCTSASVFQTTSILFFLSLMKISLQLHTLFLNSWVRTFAKTPKISMSDFHENTLKSYFFFCVFQTLNTLHHEHLLRQA